MTKLINSCEHGGEENKKTRGDWKPKRTREQGPKQGPKELEPRRRRTSEVRKVKEAQGREDKRREGRRAGPDVPRHSDIFFGENH